MGLRFRRSIKLAPGLRLNVSGSGLSVRVGPPGASVSFGRRGTYLNTGIPGTGLYARERLDAPSRAGSSHSTVPNTQVTLSAKVTVKDDGEVQFCDTDGNPLSPVLVHKLKLQQGSAIHGLIEDCCKKVNDPVEALGRMHLYTPNSHDRAHYTPQPFPEPEPRRPEMKQIGVLGKLLRFRRERIERENAERTRLYSEQQREWQQRKGWFETGEAQRKKFIEQDILLDTSAMERFLEENLQSIEWPRETHVSFNVTDNGQKALVDVALPSINEMPTKTATVPSQGYRLHVKDMSAAQLQKLYVGHAHSVGFRIIGEVFADLPTVQWVVLSAFTERSDPGTGALHNDYVYSVRVTRDAWERIDFGHLPAIDVVEALGRFELRRDLTRTGALRTVEPFAA